VPTGHRWWRKEVSAWAESCEGVTPLTRQTYREHVGAMPGHFKRLGLDYPASGNFVTRAMIETYAHDQGLAPTTRAMNLGLLRQFLEWKAVPLAAQKKIWKGPRRVATRRYWLTKDQLTALLNAAEGRERVALLLMGANGLRQLEVRLLRVRDCHMEADSPTLDVTGKFDKVRQIAMNRLVWSEMLPLVTGKNGNDRVYPWKRSTIARDLWNACDRAGIPRRSPHDLRRTFGRLAYKAGVPLTTIQGFYGHEKLEQTVYYIGIDQADGRAGMDRLEGFLDPSRPGNGVSGPAAPRFTDVPARSQ
jgi:integrase